MKTEVPLLHCPSDPSAYRLYTIELEWQGKEVAVTSYKGVLGDSRVGGNLSIHRPPWRSDGRGPILHFDFCILQFDLNFPPRPNSRGGRKALRITKKSTFVVQINCFFPIVPGNRWGGG